MTKENLLKIVGQNIKNIREEKNISQQQLAAACNFEKSNMSRIEAGRSNLTLYSLYKISNVLDVRVEKLVQLTNE